MTYFQRDIVLLVQNLSYLNRMATVVDSNVLTLVLTHLSGTEHSYTSPPP